METVKTIKGYELRERIGSGGFGVVHRAYQATVGREVAIKIILPHFANQPDFIRRFETEAQLIARLEHPFIVPLYDYWRDPDGAYLVMRWLRGGSLRDALAQGPFELEAAALFMDQISSALALAHRNGVIHRDLKPANILLDEDGNAYLSDFGIAKNVLNTAGSQTGTDVILGSPDYLSPEQARSEPVSPQTDIYSLGVMLYEVLTGQHPFPNMTSVERMYKHINEPLPLIETLSPEIAEGIDTIIQKATAKNPAQRYSDVLAMAADFRRETALGQQAGENIVEQLTLREHEILQMIIDGCSNKDIAQRLYITVGTVKWHVRQIYQKLHVRSRVQAMMRARELNLLLSDTSAEPAPLESTFIVLPEPENPYKGLRAFQMADARDFFGRERLVQRLVKRLGERDKLVRFLAVVGPSGSGKSSVVRAGLIPALWRGDLPGSERWFVVEMTPGAHPLDELEIALTRVAANYAGNLREHLDRDSRGLVRVAGLILPDDGSDLIVIVDQFEEMFTLLEDETIRIRFLDLLYTAVTDPRSRVRVVVTLRADFYDRPLHYADFGELVRSRMETVLPLSADELEAAIAKPAARVGVTFEPGLVATITGDVHYQPGALPLLQYALTELFEQRSNRTLTHEAYQALGGASGALAKRAEELVHEQNETGQEVIRQMFLRLVTLGEGLEDTRRRVPRSELLAVAGNEDLMDEAIDTYAAYRLLTLDHDPVTRSPTVEIAHEAILREWVRLRTWLNESRDDIRQQRLLAAAATEWIQAGKDPSYLLRGTRLEQFAEWAADTQLALTPKEQNFLDTSIAEHQRQETAEQERQQRELETQRQLTEQQRRSANRLRYLVIGLAVFLSVALVLAVFALDARSTAQNERDHANTARRVAEREAAINQSRVSANYAEQSYARGETDLALAFALQAVEMPSPPPESVQTLREIAQGYGTRAVFTEHTGFVRAVAFSPDSSYAVSGGCREPADRETCPGGELILMDLEKNATVYQREAHAGAVNALAFSADGARILSGGGDGNLLLWDVQTGEILRQYDGDAGPIYTVVFRPTDGGPDTAATGAADGSITLWNVETGEIIQTFGPDNPDTDEIDGHTGQVNSVAFSPDGTQLVSASDDTTLILWNVETGAIVHRMEGHQNAVTTAKFVPGSNSIISGSLDVTIRKWDATTGQEITPVPAPIGDSVYALDITPDGQTILVGIGLNVKFWDISGWEEIHQLADGNTYFGVILSLALSADGHRLIAGTMDWEARTGLVWEWNLEQKGELRRFNTDGTSLGTVAISADGRTLFSGIHLNCGGILWDVESGTEIRRFMSEDGEGLYSLGAALFQVGDHQRAVVACSNQEGSEPKTWLDVWDTASGQRLYHLTEHQNDIWRVVVSPDGEKAISAAMNELFLWNLASGELIRRFEIPGCYVFGLALNEDGTRALTGIINDPVLDGSPSIVLWDIETGAALERFPFEPVTGDIKFGPDETTAVITTGDGRIMRLDLATHETVWQAYLDNQAWVVSLSPAGEYVLVRETNTGALSLWNTATGDLIQHLGSHHGEPPNVVFSPDSHSFFSTGLDGALIEWSITDMPLETLIRWIENNRYIRDFTCRERVQYRIEPLCG